MAGCWAIWTAFSRSSSPTLFRSPWESCSLCTAGPAPSSCPFWRSPSRFSGCPSIWASTSWARTSASKGRMRRRPWSSGRWSRAASPIASSTSFCWSACLLFPRLIWPWSWALSSSPTSTSTSMTQSRCFATCGGSTSAVRRCIGWACSSSLSLSAFWQQLWSLRRTRCPGATPWARATSRATPWAVRALLRPRCTLWCTWRCWSLW
mmetsp:Transcript_61140/g.145675  ORF Transcript_61140/g.145675 Transcript_61140/m.145675 type:complete len:207 (+) Transcript_61140:1980-2600(+)